MIHSLCIYASVPALLHPLVRVFPWFLLPGIPKHIVQTEVGKIQYRFREVPELI